MTSLLSFESIKNDYKSTWQIPYSILLETAEWNNFREKVLYRDGHSCTICKKKQSEKVGRQYYKVLSDEEVLQNQKEETIDLLGDGTFVIKLRTAPVTAEPIQHPTILHVHHTYYVFGDAPWEYPDEAVITVCHDCHIEIHNTEIIPFYYGDSRKERLLLTPCRKCSGTGFLHQYYYYQNGICFRCKGRRFEEFI